MKLKNVTFGANVEDTGVSLEGVDLNKVAALAAQIQATMKVTEEQPSLAPYADMEHKRFPVYTEELAKASKVIHANLQGVLRDSYTEEAWTELGETISKALKTAYAAHDEEEDVQMVRAMMAILRELMIRELKDGDLEDTHKLYEMVSILSGLKYLSMMENWEVPEGDADASLDANVWYSDKELQRLYPKVTNTQVESTEGKDDEEVTEDDIQKISETVSAALATANAPVLQGLTDLIAVLGKTSTATATEETKVDETEAPKAEVTSDAVEDKGKVVEVETPVVAAAEETKAEDTKEESTTEEAETTTEDSTEAQAALADLKKIKEANEEEAYKALIARASSNGTEVTSDTTEEIEDIPAIISRGGNALAGLFEKETVQGVTASHTLGTQEGREAYLATAARERLNRAGVPTTIDNGESTQQRTPLEMLLDPKTGIFRK